MDEHEIERWSPCRAFFYSLFSRNPKSNRVAVERAHLTPADRFLDIGCGPGAALEHAVAAGAALVAGIDPSQSMVDRAARRVPSADVRVGSAEQIPFPDGEFSVVINILSFHHWADRDAGLREIVRVLAPGGRLHIIEGALRAGKDGHGLNPTDSELVAARLGELGCVETEIETITPGRRFRYVVVSGVLSTEY